MLTNLPRPPSFGGRSPSSKRKRRTSTLHPPGPSSPNPAAHRDVGRRRVASAQATNGRPLRTTLLTQPGDCRSCSQAACESGHEPRNRTEGQRAHAETSVAAGGLKRVQDRDIVCRVADRGTPISSLSPSASRRAASPTASTTSAPRGRSAVASAGRAPGCRTRSCSPTRNATAEVGHHEGRRVGIPVISWSTALGTALSDRRFSIGR